MEELDREELNIEESKERKQKRRGLGRLYKRDKEGREYPPSSRVHGAYFLEHRINGRRVRERLTHPDGKSITTLREAEKQRALIRAPYATCQSCCSGRRP